MTSYDHAGVYQWQITEASLALDSTKWSQATPIYRLTAFIGNSGTSGLEYVNWYIERMTDDAGTPLVDPEKIDAGYDPTSTSEMVFGLNYVKEQTLSASKEVEGAFGDKSHAFPIRTTLYLPDWYAEQGSTAEPITYSDSTQAGVPTWNSTVNTWTLQVTNNLADAQSKTFVVPVGTRYEVKEMNTSANGSDYTPSVAWTTNLGTHSITYVASDSNYTGSVTRQANPDGSIIVENNPFGTSANVVSAWNTDPDGVSGTAYIAGVSIPNLDSDVTLYAAAWERAITVHYNVNEDRDGGGTVYSKTLGWSDTIPLDTTITNPGYTFGGWFNKAGQRGAIQISSTDTVGDVVTNVFEDETLDEITIYAHWLFNTYTVYFDVNSVDGSPVGLQTTGFHEDHFIMMDSVRDGHEFIEWNTEPDGSGITVDSYTCYYEIVPDDSYMSTTLYAIWDDTPRG